MTLTRDIDSLPLFFQKPSAQIFLKLINLTKIIGIVEKVNEFNQNRWNC